MAEYHVGCGLAGIYAGTFKKKNEWRNKTECTDEALSAVAQYLVDNDELFQFAYKGRLYVMKVQKQSEVVYYDN